MFRKIQLAFVLIFISTHLSAKTPTLSNESKVVLFTCGMGDQLYSGFGHSALWISDPAQGIDRLYNYGTFDFFTENFYVKFTRGKLEYMLSVTKSQRFLNEYVEEKRSAVGQNLNLTLAEKQKMFDFLENNYLPENRFYKYDFFNDNCSSRIRDVLSSTVDGDIRLNMNDKNTTFRKMLFPYLKHTPWTKFGINMILGLPADKKARTWDYMFLPEHMHDAFENATIEKNGEVRKLVQSETQYLNCHIDFKNNIWDDPIVVFSLILLIVGLISFIEFKTKKYFKWLDLLLFIIALTAGLFLLFMSVGTDHSATKYNMNILWLLPAQATFLIALFFKKSCQTKMIRIAFFYQLTVSFAMFIWPQDAEISFMLISMVYALRLLLFYRRAKIEPKNH